MHLLPPKGGSYGPLNHLLQTPNSCLVATEPIPFSRRPELRRAQWWGCGPSPAGFSFLGDTMPAIASLPGQVSDALGQILALAFSSLLCLPSFRPPDCVVALIGDAPLSPIVKGHVYVEPIPSICR